MSTSTSKQSRKSSNLSTSPRSSKSAAKRITATTPETKNSKILTMLRSSSGATIASIMKATGWQQHSVRGFLAGVVRKKLGLNLTSSLNEGQRIYQIKQKISAAQKARTVKSAV